MPSHLAPAVKRSPLLWTGLLAGSAAAVLAVPAAARAAFTYTNLNALTPAGTGVSRAFAVNNAGTVVGDFATSTSVASTSFTYFTYANGTLTPFPTVNGSPLTYDQTLTSGGRAINDAGVFAAGQGFTTLPSTSTLNEGVYNPTTGTYSPAPFPQTYVSGTMVPLGVQINGVNSAGLAVGQAFFSASATDPNANGNNHGVLFNTATDTSTDIGGAVINPAGNAATGNSTLRSVADNGSIVGSSNDGARNAAFVGTLTGTTYAYTDLSTVVAAAAPAGDTLSSSTATDISDNGQYVIGTYLARTAVGVTQTRSFLYTVGGTAVDLGTLGGTSTLVNTADGVNDLGQVVGSSTTTAGSHAYLYTGGTIADLNTLDPVTGVVFTNAQDINDLGQVVGQNAISGGNANNGFLVTPTLVPEPASAGLAAAGAAGLLARRRNRADRGAV